jgi:hypothetical protein
LSLLPLALIGVGGALGGGIGWAAMMANLSLARKSFPTALKALAMAGVVAASYGAYALLAAVLFGAIHH